MTGCTIGSGGGDVPEGWTEAADEDLRFAVPADAVVSDPPVDPQARVAFVIGDPDEPTEPYIASYRSSVVTTGGDRADAGQYAAELFGIQGGLGGLEDFTTTELTDVDVPGAEEAGRMRVAYTEPSLGDTIVQDVLLVVTDEHIYDLRFARVGEDAVSDEDVDALFGSVSVEG